ncbi:MAG: hypothetical protein GF333_06145 [Candidatus Omnitrophica bacterium]|nr:hypothetical protein [Candidatus Omnitrophota bacterium]
MKGNGFFVNPPVRWSWSRITKKWKCFTGQYKHQSKEKSMKISDYLKEHACQMNLSAQNKEEAIREIAGSLNSGGEINEQEAFIRDILERESLGSTGIGHGVAIPHSRTDSVDGFLIGFGKSSSGVDFSALDGEPVHLIFLMGANPQELNLYLRLLAELSKLLMDAAFRRELMAAEKSSDIIALFQKFES